MYSFFIIFFVSGVCLGIPPNNFPNYFISDTVNDRISYSIPGYIKNYPEPNTKEGKWNSDSISKIAVYSEKLKDNPQYPEYDIKLYQSLTTNNYWPPGSTAWWNSDSISNKNTKDYEKLTETTQHPENVKKVYQSLTTNNYWPPGSTAWWNSDSSGRSTLEPEKLKETTQSPGDTSNYHLEGVIPWWNWALGIK